MYEYLTVNYGCLLSLFFVFKQKTAYDVRISDWSSDVCSSDLLIFLRGQLHRLAVERHAARARVETDLARDQLARCIARGAADQRAQAGDQFLGLEQIGRASCRERVCQ